MTAAIAAALVVVVAGRLRPHAPRRAPRHDDGAPPTGPVAAATPRGTTARRRRSGATTIELAQWCDAIARSLRSGATLRGTLTTVAMPDSVCTQIEPALLALARGVHLRTALSAIGRTTHDLDLVVAVLRVCADQGGAAAEPVDRAAAALRQRAAIAAERQVHSAQARMSAIVMTVLPGALLGVLLTTSGSVRSAAASGAGVMAIGAGAACNAAGWAWMRRLIAGRA